MITNSKQIKILGVLAFFYPHRGGSQKYAEELFVSLVNSYPNVCVDVLTYNTDHVASFEKYRGLNIYRIPCWNVIYGRFVLPNPFSLVATLWKLRKNQYTQINTHIRFFDPTWWVWFYAKIIGAKSIFTGHVATHPEHENKLVKYIALLVDITIAKFFLLFYDYLTFTNKQAIKFFKSSFNIKKHAYLVYGGVDTLFFTPKVINSRIIPVINTKLEKDTVLVTFVGRVTWTKGVTYLLEAIKMFYKEYKGKKSVKFVIAGPGDLKDSLIEEVNNTGLSDKVYLPGNLNYTQVRDLLQISDVFINPSHHNEGFPNTILESGAAGCFVIATDNAGTKEVVINKQTGLLVPQKDAVAYKNSIVYALNNSREVSNMKKAMRTRLVNIHDWKVVASEFYKILTK